MKFKNIRFPVYILIFAAYPAISLLETNFNEINPWHVFRPLIFSSFFSILSYFGFNKIYSDPKKSGVITSIFILIVFNYGRVFSYLYIDYSKTTAFGYFNHLIVAAAAALLLWLFISLYNKTKLPDPLTLTAVGIVLLVIPGFQISSNLLVEKEVFTPKKPGFTTLPVDQETPDIYHIVLDSYSREDQLQEMGFDNSTFLQSLEEMGFYVSPCSRSNYQRTTLSLTSALNLDYMWEVIRGPLGKERGNAVVYSALKNNLSQAILKDLGYTIINNKNGFKWAELSENADIFIRPKTHSFTAPYLLSFERLFLENSAFRLFLDLGLLNTFRDGQLLYGEHYQQVHTALEALKQIPNNPDPTLAYFHMILPHEPYIFDPDGSITPRVWEEEGYLRTIEFTNSAMLEIISEILEKSETPPIILLQGDHGYIPSNKHRYEILYAIFIPEANDQMYSTISPVNTYRIIFREYFGMDYENIDDLQIRADIGSWYRDALIELPPLPDYCP